MHMYIYVSVHNKVENTYIHVHGIRAMLVYWLEGFEVVKWGEHWVEMVILYSLAHFRHCVWLLVNM